MTEFVERKENNLPVKVEVALMRAGTKATRLIPNRNSVVLKTKLGGEERQVGIDEPKGKGA